MVLAGLLVWTLGREWILVSCGCGIVALYLTFIFSFSSPAIKGVCFFRCSVLIPYLGTLLGTRTCQAAVGLVAVQESYCHLSLDLNTFR
ncbi:hypothetical protein N658DRAFT_101775 [Parathielavia hyrcaniae]|uniref:Uncharacterized protein n=1 Tax=Parathielavia hyrcaniae TaxID=113614 RepID=A0AAN6PYN1_9PEZI|nr:hypothetical protein N658DRAFT_101775 [Parathielavia hyrcaniae]